MCAVLAGDVFMIRWLAERRADVNLRCEGLNDLGFFTSQPLLTLSRMHSEYLLRGKSLESSHSM